MKERILIVDDEENVLSAIRRNLRNEFAIYVASSGQDGLNILEKHGPFPVVVSDMRMPGMDGIEFLKQTQKKFPDTVRIMLTGNADQDTATKAINEGHVYQFLNKPVNLKKFVRIIQTGITLYDLRCSERELLENTLHGSIQVLVDLLSLANPLAFTRAMRIKDYTAQVCKDLKITETWQYEISAMLSHIGYVTIPIDILEKEIGNEALKDVERNMIEQQPKTVIELIGHIPRLEPVINIIEGLIDPPLASKIAIGDYNFGSCLLYTLFHYDTYILRGQNAETALRHLVRNKSANQPDILTALAKLKSPEYETDYKLIPVEEISTGMILYENVENKDGLLIALKGYKISPVLKRQLLNFLKQKSIEPLIRVCLPKKDVSKELITAV